MFKFEPRIEKLIVAPGLAIGLALRLFDASTLYLNPDEGIHVCRSQHSDWLSNVATNGTAPPFFFFLVHYLQLLSKSELIVRLPFVLSGCIFPWLIYKLLQRLGLSVAALCLILPMWRTWIARRCGSSFRRGPRLLRLGENSDWQARQNAW